MEVNADMKKALQIILHILGFPALIGLIVYNSFEMIKDGISYGVFVFIGIIITVLFALIYFLVIGIMAKRAKRKNKQNIYRQTFVAMILSFVMLGGFWIGLDLGIPDFLADATSNTIYYEDLADNYYARSIVNKELLDEYIKRNVANGNLKSTSLEEYQAQGVRNEEVANLLKIHFKSIDKAGYVTFSGPNIDLALADRMTISVLVHLLLDVREIPETEYYLYDKKTKEVDTSHVDWNILDMLGAPMDIVEIQMLGEEGYNEFIEGLGDTGEAVKLLAPNAKAFREFISGIVNGIVPGIMQNITGSPIYIGFNDVKLQLVPSNESRGVLDYQSMAWLDSNGLVYAIVMLFSTRKFFLIFAGWMVLSNFIIGMLRGMGEELKAKNIKKDNSNQYRQSRPYNPYEPYGYSEAMENMKRSGIIRQYDMNYFK